MTYSHIFKDAQLPKDTGIIGRMETSYMDGIPSLCQSCLYYNRITGSTCSAFPGGIPNKIIIGGYDHTFEFKQDGFDDGGITYTQEP